MAALFQQELYLLLQSIPKGKITTYKILAQKLNVPSARAIGQALKHNPDPIKYPCYRVVKSNGEIGGYYGNNHWFIQEKIKKLEAEGIVIKDCRIQNIKNCLHNY